MADRGGGPGGSASLATNRQVARSPAFDTLMASFIPDPIPPSSPHFIHSHSPTSSPIVAAMGRQS